jgi:threonine dehydrogenase-like Zn-dependent dehydrogenase
MRHPYEEMEAGATLPGLGDTSLGNPTMEALGARGVGKRAIELTCGSESGGFGFGRFRIAPEIMIQKIPDGLDFRYAAAANCACGCTYTGIEELGVRRGDFVLVAGIGFIGLGAIINAKYRGATVIALGRNAERMEMARRIGADHVLNPEDPQWLERVREITGYRQGVDYAAECSGYPYYQSKCIAAVRRYGGVFFFGHVPGSQHKLELHVLDEVMNRHVHLTGGHDVRWIDRQGLVNMLQVKEVQRRIDMMVTHEFNMSEGKAAFEAALSKKAGKIYLYPWEDCPA